MHSVMHWNGTMEDLDPRTQEAQLVALLRELETAPEGYGKVSLFDDDTGWAITAFRDGNLLLYNAELNSPMAHLRGAEPLEIWRRFLVEGTEAIRALPWQAGPG